MEAVPITQFASYPNTYTKEESVPSPVKITRDHRVITAPNAPPLTGSQMLELGKKLLHRGCIAVALEAVDQGRRMRSRPVSRVEAR